MNTTKRISIGNTSVARQWPYAGVAALLVALIAAASFVALSADRSKAEAPVAPSAPIVPFATSDMPAAPTVRPLLTYYLVNSPEQAAQADLLENEATMASMDGSSMQQRQHHVYQITSHEDEQYTTFVIGTASYELAVSGTWDFQVVDLRTQN